MRLKSILTLGTAMMVAATLHADSGEDNSSQLVQKRKEVETLSMELEALKSKLRSETSAYQMQKNDLERQIKAEDINLTKVSMDLEKARASVDKTEVSRNDLLPILEKHLAGLENHIRQSLPFKQEERLKEVSNIMLLVKKGEITLERALASLWSLLETEFKMTHENGLYKQTIQLGGESVLADVVKLGMTHMYFKTVNGELGMVVRSNDRWECKVANEPDEKAKIVLLFDSMNKKIREGFFELPNPEYAGANQ